MGWRDVSFAASVEVTPATRQLTLRPVGLDGSALTYGIEFELDEDDRQGE